MPRVFAGLILLLSWGLPCLADDVEDRLRGQLTKSELVIIGVMEDPPQLLPQKEAGISRYHCRFTAKTVLKGQLVRQTGLHVYITRVDRGNGEQKEKHVPLEQGNEYILFLSNRHGDRWEPVEVMGYDVSRAKIVSRLVDEEYAAAEARIDRKKLGILKGRIVYDGEAPARTPLPVSEFRTDLQGNKLLDADLQRFSQLQLLDESLIVGPDRGVQNVLIWITDKSIPVPPLPPARRLPAPATLTFKDGRLQPHLLVWWADQRPLRMENADPSGMNMHLLAGQGNEFNQLLKPQGKFDFQAQGLKLPTKLQSDIYPWAHAMLFPCAHPYFAVTDAEGYFSMPDIPFGNWEFRVWHERCGYLKTDDWPKGHFQMQINASIVELRSVKVAPEAFVRRPSVVPVQQPRPKLATVTDAKSGRRTKGDARRKSHDIDKAAELLGKWRMRLPGGARYEVTLEKSDDGLLKLNCPIKLTLLGTFAFDNKQLQLVHSDERNVDDYIWQLNDEGRFILTTDKQHLGGDYLGAVLEMIK